MSGFVLSVFVLVYLGMIAGRLPRLRLDRTGVALLGAIVLLAGGALDLQQAVAAVDAPTLALLFALMVVSAQLRLGGFYAWVARACTAGALSPPALLAAVVLLSGVLSAIFCNDIVCLAVTPVLVDACRRRGLDPVPFLLALACASNVGSAATLIGNPQNMLIGQALALSFGGYLLAAAAPVTLGLLATWGLVAWQQRDRWAAADGTPSSPVWPAGAGLLATLDDAPPPFDRWQATKGLAVVLALLAAFLGFPEWPREVAALLGAGVLLLSRRLHSRAMLGLVDWQLLVLFAGLFVVNHALAATGLPARLVAGSSVDLTHPAPLFALTVLLSNLVSNVPAVMLLLPFATHELAGPLLALASTLAGNLFLVGSIANLIVVDGAARHGVAIDWRRHARTGVPVTLVTLAIAAAWLWVVA